MILGWNQRPAKKSCFLKGGKQTGGFGGSVKGEQRREGGGKS